MTFPLNLESEAEADLAEAYLWYENQRTGLGREFIECVETVFARIQNTPELYAATYKNVRQVLVRRFPYVVCYVFEENRVDVVAVFHAHRDSSIWQSRVDDESGDSQNGD